SCSKAGVEQKFAIAFSAEDRRLNHFNFFDAELNDESSDFVHSLLLDLRIFDDAALADVFAASLELRFYKNDDFAAGPLTARREGSHDDGGQNQRRRDEGDVHCDQVNGFSDLFAQQVAGIGVLKQTNARILTQLKRNLAMAGIEGDDESCAMLEQAVSESAG